MGQVNPREVGWIFTKPEIERVYAVTDRGNLASRTVMEKAGMAFEKEVDLYDSVVKGNGLLPFYSLDRTGFRRETGQTDGVVVSEAEEPDCVKRGDESIENRVLA